MFRRLWDHVTIEPVVACYMAAFTLISLTVSNLNLQKACLVNLRLSKDTCDALVTKSSAGDHAGDEVTVQQLVAGMMLWQTCAQYVLPCVLMLLVGSWSDRTRRRVPCMLLPIYGELIRNAGQLLCVYYFYQLPMEAAGLVETIPLAVTGGQSLMTMTAYSYISDITPDKHRSFKIGVLNAVMATSIAIGTSLSGIIYNKLGFYGAYGISSLLLAIGLIYGLFCVNDVNTATEVDKNKSYNKVFTGFFHIKYITQSFNTTFKNRPNSQRLRIIILLIILMTNSGTTNGFRTVSYLYTRVQFNWNELKYSIYSTYEVLIQLTGLLFCIFVLIKQLKISDEIIGMLSTISKTLASIFFIFAYNEFLFYMGTLVNILIIGENISIKSLMAKLVPNTELSQIAAVFGIAETIVSLVFGLMYNGLYEVTLNKLPSAFYFLSFIFCAPTIFMFIWMYVERKREHEYTNGVLNCKKNIMPSSNNIDTACNYGAISKM